MACNATGMKFRKKGSIVQKHAVAQITDVSHNLKVSALNQHQAQYQSLPLLPPPSLHQRHLQMIRAKAGAAAKPQADAGVIHHQTHQRAVNFMVIAAVTFPSTAK